MATSKLQCIRKGCNCDAVFKPEFHFTVRRGKKIIGIDILLDHGFCEPHSMLLGPEDILKLEDLQNLEQRLVDNKTIAPWDILNKRGFLMRWVPIAEVSREVVAI